MCQSLDFICLMLHIIKRSRILLKSNYIRSNICSSLHIETYASEDITSTTRFYSSKLVKQRQLIQNSKYLTGLYDKLCYQCTLT